MKFLPLLLVGLAGCSFLPPTVTMDEFKSLTRGDTLDQAQKKIGDLGVLASEADGVQVWQWANASGSNVMATFGPEGLTNKAQAGLE